MIEIISVALLGSVLGSFIGMLSYRLPYNMNIVERSKCPKCQHKLNALDLIPIFSWLIYVGKCCYCKEKISPRYFWIELSASLFFCYIYSLFGLSAQSFLYFLLGLALLVIIVTDLEHYMIPDSMQIVLVLLAIAVIYLQQKSISEVLWSFSICALIGFGLKYGYKFLLKKEGLGFGDVKLIAIVGLYLNISNLSLFFLLAGIIGIFSALIWRLMGKGVVFPFGPALAIAMMSCLFVPTIELSINDFVENILSKNI
jgi:prepilin signal peptidase PulO-like enzyme (type II secretory pathway)